MNLVRDDMHGVLADHARHKNLGSVIVYSVFMTRFQVVNDIIRRETAQWAGPAKLVANENL
jgi:hypothetical protein